jgi:hypothetical protein
MLGLAGLFAKGGIGNILMPLLAGAIGGGMAFGNKGYSALGGAAGVAGILGLESILGGTSLAGALPALLASGPLGWGLLAGSLLLGAFAGSLFGDHFSQADEPDIYKNQAWGQANADMQGSTSSNPMNANGKQFIMDGSTIQATNGVGWNIMMENFVSKFRSNVSQLPPSLQEAFPQIEQLWGGATNQRDFNNDGKDGYLDIGSGKRALWSDFWGVIQTYGQSISSLMSEYAPVDSYLASINGSVSSIGSTSMGGSGGFGSPFAMPSPGGGGGSSAAGRPTGDLVGALRNNLTLQVNANVSSSGLVQQHNLEAALEKAVMAAIANSPLANLQR